MDSAFDAKLSAEDAPLPPLPPPECPLPDVPPPPTAGISLLPPLKLEKSGIVHLDVGVSSSLSVESAPPSASPTLPRAVLVSVIFAINPDNQLIALLTKLEMVESPLDAQSGSTLSAIWLNPEPTEDNMSNT